MTRFAPALLVGALFFATPVLAQSPFDGTWKGDPKSAALNVKPDSWTIRNGSYTCTTCLPPFTVPADGKFHKVADKPYWDEIAVATPDASTATFQFRKAGKVIGESRRIVSADGKTLTSMMSNTNNGAGTRIEQKMVQTRVGTPIAGAHRVSGQWKTDTSATEVTDNARTLTLKVDQERVKLTSPLGETLDAKFGGDYAPNVGDPGKTMTKAVLLAPNKMMLTDMQNGKVVQETTYTVARDGRTIEAAWRDPRDNSSGTFKAYKQ
ncbi:hypothetical protein [Sphingomonas sp. TZW2008]|uniref:hypothetical protein n=1 Tax=Sphingomonas sp. TZW2008 TaxID=1917973 RepID=UPI000A268EF0|nr:hypothetical protein [Sphingomonas sp. TZW2008]